MLAASENAEKCKDEENHLEFHHLKPTLPAF